MPEEKLEDYRPANDRKVKRARRVVEDPEYWRKKEPQSAEVALYDEYSDDLEGEELVMKIYERLGGALRKRVGDAPRAVDYKNSSEEELYNCSKCGRRHQPDSEIGQKHQKFAR